MTQCEYQMEYELPTEDQLGGLPQNILKEIADKNQLKTYGAKKAIIERLTKHWMKHQELLKWSSMEDPRVDGSMNVLEIKTRGRIQSSLSLLSVSVSVSVSDSEKLLILPVFGQDYQEE